MDRLEEIEFKLSEIKAAKNSLNKEQLSLEKEKRRVKYEEECKTLGIEKCCKNCRYNCMTYVGDEYNTCLQILSGYNNGKECGDFAPSNKLSKMIDLGEYNEDRFERIASCLGYGDVSVDSVCRLMDCNDKLADIIIKIYNDIEEFLNIKHDILSNKGD